jgi:hypothetical protein
MLTQSYGETNDNGTSELSNTQENLKVSLGKLVYEEN